MICVKCSREIPDDAVLCCYCGRKLLTEKKTRTRGNGTGSVYRTKAGTWAAEVTLGWYMQDGKLRRKHTIKKGFRTKKDAVAYIAELQTAKKRPDRMTVSELYELFRQQSDRMSESKRTAYRIAWDKIRDAVAHRYIDDLTVSELQALTDEAGSSYYTKRDIKTLLSHCYKIAIRDDLTEKNRAQYIQLPVLESSERTIFSADEITALWNCYRSTGDVTACRMLIMLYTGIRPGELTTIRTENIHLDEQWMTGGIKTDKGRQRKIILPDCIVPLIVYSAEQSGAGLLARYSKNGLYDDWNALRETLGLRQELTPYCCRHTYITLLTALKVSPAMLQELAGHEDYDTTLEYTHLSVRDRLHEVNRLAHPA
jgi:integrase